MGLFSDTQYHRHDVKVEEKRAPTDESIKMLNEMQDKVIDNIISKIEVKNNIVEGHIYVIDGMHTTATNEIKVICKFKINGQEFVVEKSWDRWDIQNEVKTIQINNHILEYGKSIMLYFALKQFAAIAHKQILGAEIPTYYLRNLFEK